jgi:hypothetical protein
MNVTFFVRADYYDYESSYDILERDFPTLEEAQAFKARIEHYAAGDGSPEQRWKDAGEWFPSGSGYFIREPHIIRRVWEEEVVS